MRKYIIALISLMFFGCVGTMIEKTELNRKPLGKTFEYVPGASEIEVRFIVEGDSIVGFLYKQEKDKYSVLNRGVRKFRYDKNDRLQGDGFPDYWYYQSLAWLFSFGFYIPVTIIDLSYSYSKTGDIGEFEETENVENNSYKYNPNYFENEKYSVKVRGKEIKVIDSRFIIPLDDLISSSSVDFEYTLFDGKSELKSERLPFSSDHITGDSKKYKNIKQMAEKEKERRDKLAAESNERYRKRLNIFRVFTYRYRKFIDELNLCRTDMELDISKWEYGGEYFCNIYNRNTGVTTLSKKYRYLITYNCTQVWTTHNKISGIFHIYSNNDDDLALDSDRLACTP